MDAIGAASLLTDMNFQRGYFRGLLGYALEAMTEGARAVPEPGSLGLVAVGLLCAILARRERLR